VNKAFLRFSFFAIVVIVGFAYLGKAAQAQTLRVATGGAGNTYSTMFKEVAGACVNDVPMTEVNTSGSMQNIDMLTGNQVNGAFVQMDVLYYRARTEELGNVKTLLTLHPEEVHFVTYRDSKIKTGGVMGIMAKPVIFNTIQDLEGYVVGAVGGSYITAQVIRLQSEINFSVVQFADNALLTKALQNGAVHAAVMVGGAPLGSVNALGAVYKLLPVPEAIAAKLKNVYRPVRLNYSALGAAGVPSVATEAVFVTREYKTPRMAASLGKFRQCALEKIEELKETTGTHPKWQAVDTTYRGKWAWYDLPVTK
jgi:TRAP-type uncharacterized transport system substrate-binding protein